jgi:hypothetical protein
MEKATMATRMAATSAISAAIWALTLPLAISTSSRTTGTAAISVDSSSLAKGL